MKTNEFLVLIFAFSIFAGFFFVGYYVGRAKQQNEIINRAIKFLPQVDGYTVEQIEIIIFNENQL